MRSNPSEKQKPQELRCFTLLRQTDIIEATGVRVDLLWLNGNYQRALFHQVQKLSVTRLRELAVTRRHAALVCFLSQSYRDAVDQTVDMFDKLLTARTPRPKTSSTNNSATSGKPSRSR